MLLLLFGLLSEHMELLPKPVTKGEAPSDGIDTIRVETALSRFPMHSLSGETSRISLQNIGSASHWRVTFNAEYGPPGWLAYKIDTLIINRRIQESVRPIPKIIRLGSLREIAAELSIGSKRGTNAENIKMALMQNSTAAINAVLEFKTKEGVVNEIEFVDTKYAVVFTGEKFPDGRKADAVYIILHDIYRDILNSAQTRPLDYAYMKALPPMAQRFYEIISYQIYAALLHQNKACRLRYSEFCKLSTATRYFTYDQVKKQMYKIHKPHLDSGYLEGGIRFEATLDENDKADWWIFYKPGPNAGKQYEEFTALPGKESPAPKPTPEPPAAPPEPVDSPETIALAERLIDAGVGRVEALTLARTLPDESARQLDYLPYAEVKSTPGAYLASAIKGSFGAPKAFQEEQARRQEEERKRKAQEAQAARERAEAARRAADALLIDSEIAILEAEEPERHAAFLAFVEGQKKQALDKPFLKRGSRMAEAIVQGFEVPEKRRELFILWRDATA
jgi:hypothetical protein